MSDLKLFSIDTGNAVEINSIAVVKELIWGSSLVA